MVYLSSTACVNYGFIDTMGVCYLPVDTWLTWEHARQACINMGADLITFSSMSQMDAINAAITQLGNNMTVFMEL